jgi:catechol 2,3-dioxygenase-like lactoylglutathione lyase family enzyme
VIIGGTSSPSPIPGVARDGLLNILLAVRFSHVGITVTDLDRSRRFYESLFPFDPNLARSYPDGTLILRDADGFALALHPGDDAQTDEFLHFGYSCSGPEEVRALREKLLSAGEVLASDEDSESFVSIKVADPDGYRVEISWEDLARAPF